MWCSLLEWKLVIPQLENTESYFFVIVRERASFNCFIDVTVCIFAGAWSLSWVQSCCRYTSPTAHLRDNWSLAKELARVRHSAGKILWVQTKVREGEVILTQIPTSFNISDLQGDQTPLEEASGCLH